MRIAKFNSPVAENISKIIQDRGIKQSFVAENAGYTPQELSDMLNGRRLIKVCDIPRIAKILDVKVNDLYAAGKGGE